ncbi:hypothetical protein CGK40_24440 [Vibrio parahaemolyticus]|uniref:hypothetical protein n=1 Tax=Vibrio parahaemolyticus TaxID=670 RepID=UPI00111DFDF3|nr:hypothetical protein [Vibrio parahaemolyticus]TNZ86672.1 hypothetical protein CGK40_24440 [Vibrio parahaemolyticus]
MKLFNTIVLCLLAAVASFQSVAGDSDWSKIADKTVSFKSETDVVNPLSPFANSHFSHIKIKCTQGTVNLKSITVIMSDGKEKTFDNLGVLTKGMSSRNLNLPTKENAKLDRIELNYESLGSTALKVAGVTEKAKVEIWGKKNEK